MSKLRVISTSLYFSLLRNFFRRLFSGSVVPSFFLLWCCVLRAKRDEEDVGYKETTLERADFTLQLLMFVTAEKEKVMLKIFFLSNFCQIFS